MSKSFDLPFEKRHVLIFSSYLTLVMNLQFLLQAKICWLLVGAKSGTWWSKQNLFTIKSSVLHSCVKADMWYRYNKRVHPTAISPTEKQPVLPTTELKTKNNEGYGKVALEHIQKSTIYYIDILSRQVV
jgi:hypothetical protein